MRTHEILNDPTLSRDDAISAELDRARAHRPVAAEYEDEATSAWHAGAFHSTLPSVPDGFPTEVPAGFAMPQSEASWLRDRMLSSSPGTMLEYALQHRPDATSEAPWTDSALMSADGERASILDDARRFSALMNGASLMYNLLLAEAYEREGFDRVENPVDEYRRRLTEWAEQPGLAHDIATWDRDAFWRRVLEKNPGIKLRSRRFIDTWIDLLERADLAHLADNEEARTFISNREREHKRSQARLTNKRLLQAWLGSSGSRPLIYRWTQMRPVIHDIHDGLERPDA